MEVDLKLVSFGHVAEIRHHIAPILSVLYTQGDVAKWYQLWPGNQIIAGSKSSNPDGGSQFFLLQYLDTIDVNMLCQALKKIF